ncbi:RUS family member 1 [Protopterus annectens]|uniref:RUS family member 1 n=1 Tax=Protopterus annectens TaxID=7888 RepID=UPI001CFB34D8|nr:RUS family member 1 [Protopterus annectens]XP_043942563.1 RUS family member 1 [Protopterus annectens]XP_043942564.1 RUS family member 1 [Protopterus annectens]
MAEVPYSGEAVLFTETYGSHLSHEYSFTQEGKLSCRSEKEPAKHQTLKAFFTSVFLPQGYPDSVSSDYLTYQIWDTIQAFASSITGTLATQGTLRGVGVGDNTATVVGATVTWILKDGTGMLGRILFAWMKGTKLDCDAKKWRLFADVLNDVAIFMEIVAPAFPLCFTLIVCIAGVFKSIVGVAGGATRAALTMHQAQRDNMADVSAKDGSQETLVNLAGLLVSLLLIPLVTDSIRLTYILFILFTSLHLFANYRAVRGIVMETLNQSRLRIVLNHYLKEGKILTPAAANAKEPVFPECQKHVSIRLGVSVNELMSSLNDFEKTLKNNTKDYLLGVSRSEGLVTIVLHVTATSEDLIQACFQAELLNTLLYQDVSGFAVETDTLKELHEKCKEDKDNKLWDVVADTHILVDKMFPKFWRGLSLAGWVTDRNHLDADEWRLNQNPEDKKSQ